MALEPRAFPGEQIPDFTQGQGDTERGVSKFVTFLTNNGTSVPNSSPGPALP